MPTMLSLLAVGSIPSAIWDHTHCFSASKAALRFLMLIHLLVVFFLIGTFTGSLCRDVSITLRISYFIFLVPCFFLRKAQSRGWRTNCAERLSKCIRRPAPCHSEWRWWSYWTSFFLVIKIHHSKVFVVVFLDSLSCELLCLWGGQKILCMFCFISMSALGIMLYFLGGIN